MTKSITNKTWPFSGSPRASYVSSQLAGPPGGTLLFTPTYLIDAEAATLGSAYQNGSFSDRWSDAAGLTIAQNTNVMEGSQAWQMTMTAGSSGFGGFGGRRSFPKVYKGGSVHVQWSVYLPSDSFDWYTEGGGRLKFGRIHTTNADNSNAGYHDLYIEGSLLAGGANDGRLVSIYEGVQSWTVTQDQGVDEYMTKDSWETFEMRVDLDDVAMSSGGIGRRRIWRKKNGVMTLILDVQDEATLTEAAGAADAFLLFTYWNGEPNVPTTNQVCFADRIVVETDMTKLVETDSNGYKIIGGV